MKIRSQATVPRGSRRALFALGLSLAAIALSACGDDDSGASGDEEELITAADEICTEDARRSVEIFDEAQPAQGQGAAVDYLSELQSSRERTVEELSELEAPDNLSTDYADYVEGRGEAAASISEGIAAAEAGDQQAFVAARDRGEELTEAYEEIGERIGFGPCASVLPPEQAELAEENLTEAATSTDPEVVCEQLATEEYIESQFGSLEGCAEAQEEQPANPPDVEVTDLAGIEDVSARATLELSVENGETSRFDVNAVYEDGIFKVDAVAPASGDGS